MNKTLFLLLFFLAAAAVSFVSLSAVRADTSTAVEFEFTRLMYTENGMRGFRRMGMTMAPPRQQFTCPELGGRSFFPRQGWGWGTDYPGADCKFMWAVQRLTGIRVSPHPNVISIKDDRLFEFPYVYAVEVGGMHLFDDEAARLREYLLRGGSLHVDDFWGLREWANFQHQMQKVFPDRPIERLDLAHEVFRTFFEVDEVMQIPNVRNGCSGGPTWQRADDTMPRTLGVSDDDGRLMVLITYNSDLGDAWEYMDLPCYPAKYAGYAYRLGINFMIYAMSH